jgi:SRSO17 transposase
VPRKYWLSSQPSHSGSFRALVRKAKGRFRIKRDYEETKEEVGLDHCEDQSWGGWHHHATVVSQDYAFFMLEKMDNKKTSGLTLPTVRQWIDKWLMLCKNICPICRNRIFND